MYLNEPSWDRLALNGMLSGIYYLFGELVGMSAVGVQEANGPRGSAVTEEMQQLMNTFRVTHMKAKTRLVKTIVMNTCNVLPELPK